MLDSSLSTTCIFGDAESVSSAVPLKIFDPSVLALLSELSLAILHSKKAKEFPDLISFAFWCRSSNLSLMREKYPSKEVRLGLGKVLHITPRNVPINFAFSWALSLLAGNCNFVKLPSVHFPQITLLVDLMHKLSKTRINERVLKSSLFFQTNHSSDFLKELSLSSQARVIWGTDLTISEIKQLAAPPRQIDLTFPSRLSISIISSDTFLGSNSTTQEGIVRKFLQDSMTFSQRGCSSPRMIFWKGDLDFYQRARKEFWEIADKLAPRFLQISDPSERFSKLSYLSTQLSKTAQFATSIFGNFVVLESRKKVSFDLENYLTLGTFIEQRIDQFEEMFEILNQSLQTVTYFGINANDLLSKIESLGFLGIDRIVPFGAAFEMTPIWDGIDTIRALSRIIEVR